MEVNVQKAVKMFFSNSSFEMIYSEAFANALDAGANEIRINISLPDPTQLQNLNLKFRIMVLDLMTIGLVNLANSLMLRNNHIKVLADWFISVILKECTLKVLIMEE